MRSNCDKVENYIASKIYDECKALYNIRENSFNDKRKFIQINKIEGKILQLLIKMNNIQKIVEIGTLAGYSAIWMAKSLSNSGIVYTIEKDQEHAKIAAENFKNFSQIKLIVGDAKEKLYQIKQYAPFDMIFIDGEKSGYLYYLNWAEENIRKGGLIVADNTLLFVTIHNAEYSKKKSWQVMNEFNNKIADNTKYDSVILPTKEGLTVAIKKF